MLEFSKVPLQKYQDVRICFIWCATATDSVNKGSYPCVVTGKIVKKGHRV